MANIDVLYLAYESTSAVPVRSFSRAQRRPVISMDPSSVTTL
jgi:hypothetical protein